MRGSGVWAGRLIRSSGAAPTRTQEVDPRPNAAEKGEIEEFGEKTLCFLLPERGGGLGGHSSRENLFKFEIQNEEECGNQSCPWIERHCNPNQTLKVQNFDNSLRDDVGRMFDGGFPLLKSAFR
eukprot:783393_1